MKGAKRVFITVSAAVALFALSAVLFATSLPAQNVNAGELKTFTSEEELTGYIQQNMQLFKQYDYLFGSGQRIMVESSGTPLRMTQKMAAGPAPRRQ